jgi:hypothetical protein
MVPEGEGVGITMKPERWVQYELVLLSDAERLRDEFSRALAEVGADCERLREALERIADGNYQPNSMAKQIANRALSEGGHTQPNDRAASDASLSPLAESALDQEGECICPPVPEMATWSGRDPNCPVHRDQEGERRVMTRDEIESVHRYVAEKHGIVLDREGEDAR